MRIGLIAALLGGLLALPASALEVREVQSSIIKGGEHVSIHLSQDVATEVFVTADPPPRVVINLPTAHWKPGAKNYSSVLIKSIRLGFHDASSSRIVLDLNDTIVLNHVRMVRSHKKGYHLEFDILVRNKPKEITKAEQFKPLQKPVIIIDPGHGGQDPGTSGVGGMKEKNVTLHFAETLKEALLKTGHYRVVLTRTGDRYLFLRERVKIAREAKGNLFISLHADSAPTRSARGLSVYTISENASDKESEALAAKENKADVIGGMDLTGTSQDVADILIDLAERETRVKSAEFAKLVTHYLSREVHLLSNTHRYAGFAVLKAPDIPSILVEVGFLTSPQEEKQLESDTYRNKVAHGLTLAVDSYFAKRN